MPRLRARYPHALVLDFDPDGEPDPERPQRSWTERVAGLSDVDIATGFVADVRGAPADADERRLLGDALDCCRVDEDAA
jgi:DNA repair protein SbcD/Mre11